MSWRLAESLKVLRMQVNQTYPNRSKASDGTIGDLAHQGTASDHNINSSGVVCALDLTDDPANGFDVHALAEFQRQFPHPQLKYVVSKGRIASRKHGWVWRKSSGHFAHAHFSVGIGTDGKSAPGTYDSTTLWDIGGTMSADKLTKEEIVLQHLLVFGSKPNQQTFDTYIGQPLGRFLNDVFGMPQALKNKVESGKLVSPGQNTFDKDALYADQLLATKKVFGK